MNEPMIFDDLDIDALVEEAMRPMRAMSDAEYNAYWAERERMKASVPLEERVSALQFISELSVSPLEAPFEESPQSF